MSRALRTHLGAALALLATAWGLTACGGSDDGGGPTKAAAPAAITASIPSPFDKQREPAPGTFVGPIGDKQAYIGLVVKGDEAAVYVCNGRDKYGWFGGKLEDGEIDFESDKEIRVKAQVADDQASGTVDLGDGNEQRFTARPPKPGTGLFRAKDGGVTLGWIVLASGIRGVADEDGTSKGGFEVREETGGPGQDSGAGDAGGSGSSGSGTTTGESTPPPGGEDQQQQQQGCQDFIAGGCQMSCADLRRMHEQQRSPGIQAVIRQQMRENGCSTPTTQTPSQGSQPGTSTTPQRGEPPR